MKLLLNLPLRLEVEVEDGETMIRSIIVGDTRFEPEETTPPGPPTCEHTLTRTEASYNILTLKKRETERLRGFRELERGSSLTVRMGDLVVETKLHRTTAGRCDGLSDLYRCVPKLREGARVLVTFHAGEGAGQRPELELNLLEK